MFLSLSMRRASLLLVAFIAVQLALLPISHSKAGDRPSFGSCEKLLAAVDVADKFIAYNYTPLRHSDGFTLTPKDINNLLGERIAEIPPDPTDFDFAAKTIWKDIWQFENKKFELINIGFKSFEEYSLRMNQVVIEHLNKYHNYTLDVFFDRRRREAGEFFPNFRWAIHNAVIEKYLETKEYLTLHDLKTLETLNTYTDNSDVFGLLTYDKKVLDDLTPIELKVRLAITGQITYFGDRDYLNPSIRGLQAAIGGKIDDRDDLLPFEYRIPKDKRLAFRKSFYKRFKAQKTCELTRFALFDNKLPRPVFDQFMLNIMETVMKRKMRHLIISVDRRTARLFSRYGFQMYSELPTSLGQKNEFIYYMNVESPEFRETFERLDQSSKDVKITMEALP